MRDGAYRILEPLGKGGMGALYLAADTGAFDRTCVVKELLDYYDPTDPDEALVARIARESFTHVGITPSISGAGGSLRPSGCTCLGS
jgi:hypothetical protein